MYAPLVPETFEGTIERTLNVDSLSTTSKIRARYLFTLCTKLMLTLLVGLSSTASIIRKQVRLQPLPFP